MTKALLAIPFVATLVVALRSLDWVTALVLIPGFVVLASAILLSLAGFVSRPTCNQTKGRPEYRR